MPIFIKEQAIQPPYPPFWKTLKQNVINSRKQQYTMRTVNLWKKNIEAYVKYNYLHKERKRVWKKNSFAVQNLFYNTYKDFFIYPIEQKLTNIGTKKSKSDLGYISTLSCYQAQNCEGCSVRGLCYKAKGNRIIDINHKLNEYKRKVRERLLSEEGVYLRDKRCIEPEAVFAWIKHNHQWSRFRLRGGRESKHRIYIGGYCP